jgi:hypothetical protein
MSGHSGRTSATPFAYFDRDTSSWRTFQQSLPLENSPEPPQAWPHSGTWGLGCAYALPTSEHPTAAPGSSSLLPTPNTMEAMDPRSDEALQRAKQVGGCSNLKDVIPRLLKTPTAQLAVNGGSQHPDKRKLGGHGPTLADEVEHLL